MERCDNLQGYHFTSDYNSGFASFTEEMISIVKDDSPKLPVLLFSIKNSVTLEDTDQINLS